MILELPLKKCPKIKKNFFSRYVSDLQTAVSQMSPIQTTGGRGPGVIAVRTHEAMAGGNHHQVITSAALNINDRNRLGLSDLSGVNLNERLMQERAAHNRLVQERILQERAIQRGAAAALIMQSPPPPHDRSLHSSLIIPTATSHIITHERGGSGNNSNEIKSTQQNNIASPGPV